MGLTDERGLALGLDAYHQGRPRPPRRPPPDLSLPRPIRRTAAMDHPPDRTYPGHALDEDGALAYDPRCWFCQDDATRGPLPEWLESKLDRVADAKEKQDKDP